MFHNCLGLSRTTFDRNVRLAFAMEGEDVQIDPDKELLMFMITFPRIFLHKILPTIKQADEDVRKVCLYYRKCNPNSNPLHQMMSSKVGEYYKDQQSLVEKSMEVHGHDELAELSVLHTNDVRGFWAKYKFVNSKLTGSSDEHVFPGYLLLNDFLEGVVDSSLQDLSQWTEEFPHPSKWDEVLFQHIVCSVRNVNAKTPKRKGDDKAGVSKKTRVEGNLLLIVRTSKTCNFKHRN